MGCQVRLSCRFRTRKAKYLRSYKRANLSAIAQPKAMFVYQNWFFQSRIILHKIPIMLERFYRKNLNQDYLRIPPNRFEILKTMLPNLKLEKPLLPKMKFIKYCFLETVFLLLNGRSRQSFLKNGANPFFVYFRSFHMTNIAKI